MLTTPHRAAERHRTDERTMLTHAKMTTAPARAAPTLASRRALATNPMISLVRRAATSHSAGGAVRLGATTTTRRRAAKTVTPRAFLGLGEEKTSDSASASTQRVSTDSVMIDPVVGAKRFFNYFWAGVVTAGSTGFLLTGASAYLHHNLVFFLDASDIKFFPQGLVMSFYGVAGTMLATYLWLTISWDVGAGYNEFNKDEGIMRIFRYGFPGKNRRINLVSDLADVQAVRVEISEGVNPRRVVYVRCKGKRDIPLTRIGQPLTLAEVEQRAADLAKFLQVPIEGL